MFICVILLGVFFFAAWTASLGKSATVDEPADLVSGWAQIHFGDFRLDCENPALFKIIVGLGLPGDLFQIDRTSPEWQSLLVNANQRSPLSCTALYQTPGVDADTLLRGEHARMTVVAMVLGIAIAWWAWRLGGPIAGIFATAAFCLDANFLAHSPLVKNDVLIAIPLFLLSGAVGLFGERATLPRFAAICAFMAAAFLVKFSGILAIPVLAVSLLARSMIRRPWPIGRFVAGDFKRRLVFSGGVVFASVLAGWFCIWAGYDFRFLASPDSSAQYDFNDPLQFYADRAAFAQSPHPFQINMREVQKFRATWHPPMGARLILFANAHRLLPQSYLVGLLRIIGDSQSRPAFLCGKSSLTGWWYYFPVAMLFKTPAATLIGLAAACALMVPRLRGGVDLWPVAATAALPVIWMAVAMSSHVNVGIRHILPVYPALFVFLGVAAAVGWKRARGRGRLAAVLLAVGLAAETAFTYPNYIPFFNFFAGGSRGGLRLLSESNLDWGQDLPALAAWQGKHPDRPLYLLYWGSADPRYYGIRYVNLPESSSPADEPEAGTGRPVYAISAVVLTNPYMLSLQKNLLEPLIGRGPIAVLGGSIYIFDPP